MASEVWYYSLSSTGWQDWRSGKPFFWHYAPEVFATNRLFGVKSQYALCRVRVPYAVGSSIVEQGMLCGRCKQSLAKRSANAVSQSS